MRRRSELVALTLALGLASPACVAVPEPKARVAEPSVARRSSQVREGTPLDACGLRRPTAVPTLEGRTPDGDVAWSRAVPGLDAWVALDDGGAFTYASGRDGGLSRRIRNDGSLAWSTRWPREERSATPQATPRLLSLRPDPYRPFAVAQWGEELIVVFHGAPFGGLDVWAFSPTGDFVRRDRVLGGGGAILAGWAHEYVIDESGALSWFEPGGDVQSAGRTGFVPANPSSRASEGTLLRISPSGRDVLVTGERLSMRALDGAEAWSFGTTEPLVEAIAPAWGGVVAVTAPCEIVALDDEGVVRWSRTLEGPFTTCPDEASLSFASDDTSLVLAWRQGNGVGATTAAYAISSEGLPIFATTVEGARGLVPLIDAGGAHLGSCAGDARVALPSLATPAAATPPEGRWVQEVTVTRHLGRPIDALAVLGPSDVAALIGQRLWRWDGRAWREGPIAAAPPAQPPEPENRFDPFQVRQLFAGPGGSLWIGGARPERAIAPSGVPGDFTGAGELTALMRSRAGVTTGVPLLRNVFGVDLGGSADDRIHLALRGADVVGCWTTTCESLRGAEIVEVETPNGWRTHALGTAGDEVWALGKTLARLEGDRLVPLATEVPPSAVPDEERQVQARLWGPRPGQLWIADGALRHFDGSTLRTVTPPVATPRDVWGTAADDVWVVGRDGVAHFDGQAWAHVVGLGSAELTLVGGSGKGEVWVGGPRGLLQLKRSGPRRRIPDPAPPPAARERVRELDLGAAAVGSFVPVTLTPRGRAPVRNALELASAGDTLWLRDEAGIVELRAGRSTSIRPIRRDEVGACRQCLAPAPGGGAGVILVGGALASLERGTWRPLGRHLATMLAVDLGPRGARVAGAAERRGEPGASWLDEGAYGWDVPQGCFVAIDAHGSETWMAGGLRCEGARREAWPAGEGILVHRSAEGVRWYRAPAGPLLDVVAVGPGEAWAVGVDGAVVHVEDRKVTRMRVPTGVRLHTVAAAEETVWIGGDDRTLVRLVGDRAERLEVNELPPRSSLTSLALHEGALWIGSPDGLLRVAPAGEAKESTRSR